MIKVLVTGIAGQTGSYLAEQLLNKGYEVHGIIRRKATEDHYRIEEIYDRLIIHEGDIADFSFISNLFKEKFDYVYNLAAMSFVKYSFDNPVTTFQVDAIAPIHMINSLEKYSPETRYYQASTSEMFDGRNPGANSEKTPFAPQSPYGIAKLAAHHAVRQARQRGMFAVAGILHNHESPRRPTQFVTRKITNAVARIKLGLSDKIVLGNTTAERDWGHAREYARAMILITEADEPDEYIVGTGETHSVQEFLETAWQYAGLDSKDLSVYLERDQKYMRPNEVQRLLADPLKIYRKLGWQSEITFDELVKEMVEHDLSLKK